MIKKSSNFGLSTVLMIQDKINQVPVIVGLKQKLLTMNIFHMYVFLMSKNKRINK